MAGTQRPHDPKSPGGGQPASGGDEGVIEGTAPVVGSLDPGMALVGGPDITLDVHGSGFLADSVIYFNGGAEPTTFVSESQLSTGLKPSTASGPWTVPVWVQNGEEKSNELNFEFVEPGTTTND